MNSLLFVSCVLIWGSTWLAITYQLGEVDPKVSVAYRFFVASALLWIYCQVRGRTLRLPLHLHVKMAAAGVCLYFLDYSLLYASQQYLTSALVALMSSSIIYFNVVLRRIWLGKPIRLPVVIGASVGLCGLAMLLSPQFSQIQQHQWLWWGVLLAMTSFVFASMGNVISERILDQGAPVPVMNFWAMSYGVLVTSAVALGTGAEFILPRQADYWLALGYLAVFGSVLGFAAYMTLVQRLGSDRSAYVVLVYPLVALLLSTLFEDYRWHGLGAIGVVLILVGNGIAMGKISLLAARGKSATALKGELE